MTTQLAIDQMRALMRNEEFHLREAEAALENHSAQATSYMLAVERYHEKINALQNAIDALIGAENSGLTVKVVE